MTSFANQIQEILKLSESEEVEQLPEQEEVPSVDFESGNEPEVVEIEETPEEANFVQEEANFVQEPPPVVETKKVDLTKPIVGSISTEKMVHGSMILNGVCTACVRCGMPLTDSISIERGMGPECSSKGYSEDPKDPDEMQAMIALAEYPVLVDFLVEHYKPLGVRGLMNGLVRLACLNRKTRVHDVCTNAVELLGYKKLASALRDSLVTITIKKSEAHPGHLHVRVLRRVWTYGWNQDCRDKVPHCFYDKAEKGLIVADKPEVKRALWDRMMRHYAGECVKTPNGTIRIPTREEWANRKVK